MAHSKNTLLQLPQHPETWYLAVRELRVWITPPEESPYRPHGTLVINLNEGTIQGFETHSSSTTSDQVTKTLFEAMRNAVPGSSQTPHRPKQVHFEDPQLMKSLSSALEEIDISSKYQPAEEYVDNIISEMEKYLTGEAVSIPGMLSQKNVSPELIRALFDAAAQFYLSAPWVHLTNMQPLAVQIEPETKPRFVVVMGNAGVEYGLALYKHWGDYLFQFEPADHPEQIIPPEGSNSLFFGDITQVPFDDLNAIAKHSWEVIEDEGYPIPVVFTRDGEVKRPDRTDILWYEAAMRAITQFVPTHLKADAHGVYKPAKAKFAIPTHAGQKQVIIEYPAGDIPIESQLVESFDWTDIEGLDDDFDMPAGFDRRAMEGSLSLFGSGFDDPIENQAQEMMYAAWDEQNPAKRINLAHQALAISANCADAYVLLAEEEADTLGRALEYYQKGVEAGEQALGEAFFDENRGYFWGILESRSYMRARAGLANTLWNIGKKDEALGHYKEMLNLNPNDNQGIRYSMLGLLMDLNRTGDVDTLLEEYKDDWSSEWCYTKVLRIYQQEGESQPAQDALEEALDQNPHVPEYLTGKKRIPNRLPDLIAFGKESEAVSYASTHLNYWRKTSGATNWLKEQTHPPSQKSAEKPIKKAKRGRRGKKK